jgi:hypothetical protein
MSNLKVCERIRGPLKPRTGFDLTRFPKSRTPLPERYREIYASHYRINRDGVTYVTSLSKRMESWLHRAVGTDVQHADREVVTLEIGAGTLNQLSYEPQVGPYDIVEPFSALFVGSPLTSRVRQIYSDISHIRGNSLYDRITSIATFEHLCDLPALVARTGTLLKSRGCLRVAIPSEGTILWSMAWKLTTGLEYRIKYGLDYGVLMRYEHVNEAKEIEDVLNHFYGIVRRRVFGISRSLSFYQFFECFEPRKELCRDFLARTAGLGPSNE